ncbi:MAG: NADPH-dependent F420 reductase [Promethearchaeota archaeon]
MKKIGVLGTGSVGTTIGSKLIQLGYEVKLGSRTPDNETAAEWVKNNGLKASQGTFEAAANFGGIIFLCVKGEAALKVLEMAKEENLNGKTVIDISNPLDFSKGMPPTLFVCNTDSLAEQIQRAFAEVNFVNTLNIVNCDVMVNPKISGGDPTMFLCGNDPNAKEEAKEILKQFGWNDIIDLGDISAARGTEMILPIWLQIWNALQDGHFAFKILRK